MVHPEPTATPKFVELLDDSYCRIGHSTAEDVQYAAACSARKSGEVPPGAESVHPKFWGG